MIDSLIPIEKKTSQTHSLQRTVFDHIATHFFGKISGKRPLVAFHQKFDQIHLQAVQNVCVFLQCRTRRQVFRFEGSIIFARYPNVFVGQQIDQSVFVWLVDVQQIWQTGDGGGLSSDRLNLELFQLPMPSKKPILQIITLCFRMSA